MNNDIKDLLDRCTPYLFGDEVDKLTDYIINLQTIEQQYSAILSENAELEDRLSTLKIEISRLMSKYFYEKDFCLEDTHLDKLLRIIDGDNILEGSDK